MVGTSQTQKKKRDRQGILNESNKFSTRDIKDSSDKCTFPATPIYPVRYGLSIDYLNQANNGNIGTISRPSGMLTKTNAHQLMQLRQGFIYIYAHNRHKLFSTDEKGKWLVFRYVTESGDLNSGSKFEKVAGQEYANTPFVLCKWGKEGANGDWQAGKIESSDCPNVKNMKAFSCAFVARTVGKVDIAYSEYKWSSEIIEKLESNAAFRQAIMTTIDTQQLLGTHQHPLESLAAHVPEYIPNNHTIAHQTKDWHTQLQPQPKLPQTAVFSEAKKGIMVALEDAVGEMHELQKVMFNLTEKQKNYYARYAYPITIGNMIDPKIAYDVRGKKYPFKEKERVIVQKGVQSALVSEFNSKLTTLLREPFERYEKPMAVLVKQIVQMANQRPSFKSFFTISNELARYRSSDNTTDRGFYVFYRLVADLTYGLECSPEGIAVLETLFSDKSAPVNNSPTSLAWLREHSKKVTDVVYLLAIKMSESQRHKQLKGYFAAMEYVYLNTGRTMADVISLRKANFAKVFAIYNLDENQLIKNADYFFAEIAEKWMDRLMKQERSRQYDDRRGNGGKKAIKRELGQIKQALKAQNKITATTIQDINTRLAFSERYYGFSGILAIYAGILSLNNDLTVSRKLAHTGAGRLAVDPVIVKTTAILDISVGTADTAYALKLMDKPNAGLQALKNMRGASARTWVAGVRSLAYVGASIIGGVLTAVIAFGGLRDAAVNEDKVSVVANGAIMLSGVMIGLGAIPTFSTLGPIGWVILLVATASIFFWGSTPLETWVKKGFWGKSIDYLYWENRRRDREFNTQIKRAEILANKEIAQLAQRHLERMKLIADGQVDAVSGSNLPINKQVEDYILISQGFEQELYEYDIQSGLKISEINSGYYRIRCAEFRRTKPTTGNLVIKLYQWGSSQAQLIKQFYVAPTGEVTFYLAENNIRREDIRIIAEFRDKEGETFKDVYLSKAFKNRTQEVQQRGQKAIEEFLANGYSE